jgi:hypothetical protein
MTTAAGWSTLLGVSDSFPADFMFVLHHTEFENWRSQFVTSNADCRGLRHPPMAFTKQPER